MKSKAKKKDVWFYKVRASYLPKTWQGWVLYIPYTLALIDGVLWARQPGTMLFDQILKVVIVWVAAAEAMTLIAKAKS